MVFGVTKVTLSNFKAAANRMLKLSKNFFLKIEILIKIFQRHIKLLVFGFKVRH